VEAYAVEDLAARAEAAGAGLGVLVAELVRLAGDVAGPELAVGSFDEIEQRVCVRGRELLRMVLQHAMDAQAAGERRLAVVTDAAGVARTRVERGHARTVVSSAGPVIVRRLAYRAAGAANLHPRDAVLNLPARRYSWAVQATAAGFALEASFGQASQWLAGRIGTTVHHRQIEQIVVEAARDCEGFYATRAPAAAGREIPLVLGGRQGRGDAPGSPAAEPLPARSRRLRKTAEHRGETGRQAHG
jgi:hypothetical protein